MARQAQRTVTLPAGDLAKLQKMADEHAAYVDTASFFRYALVIGGHVLDETLKDLKPGILGAHFGKSIAPTVLEVLLKTKLGRRAVKLESVASSEAD